MYKSIFYSLKDLHVQYEEKICIALTIYNSARQFDMWHADIFTMLHFSLLKNSIQSLGKMYNVLYMYINTGNRNPLW